MPGYIAGGPGLGRLGPDCAELTMAPLPLLPPLWREGRLGLEVAALMRSKVWRGDDVEDAGGQPVMLIPGFLAGDDSLGPDDALAAQDRPPHPQGGDARQHRLLERGRRSGWRSGSRCLADARGERVAIIGQSRGGNFAKVLAVRHPDLVSGIVTLGSPQLDPLDIHPFVRAQVYAVGTLGTLGMRGMFSHGCLTGQVLRGLLGGPPAAAAARTSATCRSTRRATAS